MAVKLQSQIVEIPYDTAPGSKHSLVLEAVKQRRKMSYDKMSQRYAAWAEQEEKFRAYVKPTKGDSDRSTLKKEGKPQYVTMEIPYSFALLMTFHTYLTSVFLSRNPVMQYEGRHAEPEEKVLAVEAVIDYQLNVGQWLIPLYIWLMDMGKYGLGVISEYWCEESVVTTETKEMPASYFGIPVPGKMKKVKNTIRIPGYKGHRLFNVRPQDWFPDPRVSVANFQQGEFCARRLETGWNTILKQQATGKYYNVDMLKTKLKQRCDTQRDRGSAQLVLPDAMETMYIPSSPHSSASDVKNFVELLEMEIELIPRDWGFGTSPYPEMWVITMANNEVILSIEPMGLYHGKFTFDVIEYEIEGYALTKRGMLEILSPLNDTMSWLINSHMHNVRRAINDQVVVDPSRIVMKDLMDPAAGRIVRVKPEAYGQDVSLAVKQLEVVDITAHHVNDAALMGEMMQRISGVVESVMGMIDSGGRKTATEVRASSSFAVNRLKTNAEYASAMGFAPLSQKILQTTQQKYDGEMWFRVAGDLTKFKEPMKVMPEDIAGFYDFVPVDGTMPVDRYAQAMLWKEIMGAAATIPQLQTQMDFMALMEHVAYLGGIKDFENFRIQVLPDAAVAANAAAGNVVPLGGPGSGVPGKLPAPGVPGPGTAGGRRDLTQIPQSGGTPGVGRAA